MSKAGRIKMSIGVASRTRVRSFSRDIQSMSVPTAISQPESERAVRGVNCQGKTGMRKLGKKKVTAAIKVNKLPQMISSRFSQEGMASLEEVARETARR